MIYKCSYLFLVDRDSTKYPYNFQVTNYIPIKLKTKTKKKNVAIYSWNRIVFETKWLIYWRHALRSDHDWEPSVALRLTPPENWRFGRWMNTRRRTAESGQRERERERERERDKRGIIWGKTEKLTKDWEEWRQIVYALFSIGKKAGKKM